MDKNERTRNTPAFTQLCSNLKFAYKFIWTNSKLLFLIRFFYVFIQVLQTIIPIFFIREILNRLTLEQNAGTVIFLVIVMAIMNFIIYICSLLLKMADSQVLVKLQFKGAELLADSVMNMSYETVDNSEVQDCIWLARYNNFNTIYELSMDIISSVITMFSIGLVVFTLNPIILVLIIISCIVGNVINKYTRTLSAKYEEDHAVNNRQNYYLTGLMEFPEQGMDIRTNNLEKWICDNATKNWWKNIFPYELKFTKKNLVLRSITDSIVIVQELFIYVFLIIEIVNKALSVGDFSMYVTAANTFSSCLHNILSKYSDLMLQSATYLDNYYRCIKISDQQSCEEKHMHMYAQDNMEIEFRNVSFKYPNSDTMVLEHINLKIKKGETLSIVGINGAGKTTFVKLLCRFYEPTEGTIYINGIPAQDIPLNEYYSFISAVFQDFTLFQFKIFENITMDTEYDIERLNQSILFSGLTKRIETLPNGIETYLYKLFDQNGIELSKGEEQKVAIARVFYQNSPIIIFDEPTSALDPIAEYNIYQNFHNIIKNKTVIYISHRLASTKFVDNIAVFSNGTIAEYGTHEQLMLNSNGIYAKMFSAQAKYYQE